MYHTHMSTMHQSLITEIFRSIQKRRETAATAERERECVCERERGECVCERAREREGVCECVSEYVNERERVCL